MDIPKRHDLTSYNRQFEFELSGFCSQQWEISARQKWNIIWGVVLSYLKSAEFKFPAQFEERLSQLTNGSMNAKQAKTAIANFNPFFNIHKCFFDETLKEICVSFRNIVSKLRGKEKRQTATDFKNISSFLRVKILIVNLAKETLHVISPEGDSSGNFSNITFFYKQLRTEENDVPNRFHFGLDDDLCTKLRKEALEIILETSEFKKKAEEEIHPMLDRGEKNINFLITLLKKYPVCPLSYLYDSSYIAMKLSNAGFETDPTVLDSEGFSAFYYALRSNDSSLVYILYRYAANICYESENTFRTPNPAIISNFSNLRKILESDCINSNNFEKCDDRAEQTRLNYEDLLRFNDFLTRISHGIHKIRKQPECKAIDKASKRKDVILNILETYVSEEFFFVGQLDYENYKKHEAYFNNLDSYVALLFFDNIFLLKSVLKSPREYLSLYSDLESSFLLSAMGTKYINEYNFNNDSIISFLERLNLEAKILNFCKILKEEKLVQSQLVGCVENEEIDRMLSGFPELKHEFSISRLDRYLKPIESVSEGFTMKLVIQRALQVIGETVKVKKEDNPSPSSDKVAFHTSIDDSTVNHSSINCPSQKWMLSTISPASLHKETVEDLKKARNILCKLNSYQFQLKFELEQDDCLFTSIQFELINIKKTFERAIHIHRVRLEEFLLNRAEENIKKYEGRVKSLESVTEDFFRKRKTMKKGLTDVDCKLEKENTREHNKPVPCIKEFCRRLSVKEKIVDEQQILLEVPQHVVNHSNALEKFAKDIEEETPVDVLIFDSLILSEKHRQNIKKAYDNYLKEKENPMKNPSKSSILNKIKKIPNPQKILKEKIFKKKKVSNSQLKSLHEMINFSTETKNTLNKLIENSSEPCSYSLTNLLNRINYLHQIAIEEQHDISYLWERAKSREAKQYLVYKIVQRYFRDPVFQAAVEMLLFDCLAILKYGEKEGTKMQRENGEGKINDNACVNEKHNDKNITLGNEKRILEKNSDENNRRKNEKSDHGKNEENNLEETEEQDEEDRFWLKTSYLFNGIDVRNVLAHGDFLLESIGDLLDPKDFPSELITKLLQLLEDRDCIEALCKLWEKVDKIPESADCHKLKKRIIFCQQWKNYSKLLTENPEEDETYKCIVSFLENSVEPLK